MKHLYKPIGIANTFLAGFVAKQVFKVIWTRVNDQPPPKAKTAETTWTKLIVATALQAVTFKVTKAAVDRAGAKAFERITGIWPGDAQPDEPQPSGSRRGRKH